MIFEFHAIISTMRDECASGVTVGMPWSLTLGVQKRDRSRQASLHFQASVHNTFIIASTSQLSKHGVLEIRISVYLRLVQYVLRREAWTLDAATYIEISSIPSMRHNNTQAIQNIHIVVSL